MSQQKSEAEVIPVVPDQDKIRNKNFDTKTSFRPKMKQKNIAIHSKFYTKNNAEADTQLYDETAR